MQFWLLVFVEQSCAMRNSGAYNNDKTSDNYCHHDDTGTDNNAASSRVHWINVSLASRAPRMPKFYC